MNQTAVNRKMGPAQGSDLAGHPEMVLLGGRDLGHNRTRVMNMNRESCITRPADLDAFLRGFFRNN